MRKPRLPPCSRPRRRRRSRLNLSVQGGYGAQGFWYDGRFGCTMLDRKGLVRAVADRIVSAAGALLRATMLWRPRTPR